MMLDKNYWTDRYKQNLTGWDVGHATPPIVQYFAGVADKSTTILIAGAGNAHEAAHLHQQGFTNVHVCDISPEPIATFLASNPTFPKGHVHLQDFFTLEGSYDILVEQTFFCALHPSLRNKYVQHSHDLLKHDGHIVGLLFGQVFEREGPPFGGTTAEYRALFSTLFDIHILESCTNSISPRMGLELFVRFAKKDKK